MAKLFSEAEYFGFFVVWLSLVNDACREGLTMPVVMMS